jgi:hypothetical protein
VITLRVQFCAGKKQLAMLQHGADIDDTPLKSIAPAAAGKESELQSTLHPKRAFYDATLPSAELCCILGCASKMRSITPLLAAFAEPTLA